MLEQLYYSWPLAVGSQYEAASSGLTDARSERFRAIMPFLNYKLPQGTDTSAVDLDKTPLSLLFADTGKERILAQKVYKGRDKYSRETHFIHLLAGLPENFVACDAIELWKSSFWATTGDTASFSLPTISVDELKRQPGTLNESDIASVQQYLPPLIQAYLTLSETQKIYIAAPNAQVAALIWGLTHCISRTLQQSLTFNTYEYSSAYDRNVTRDSVRIVCTSEPATALFKGYDKPVDIIPAECYVRNSFAINCYSGKTSDLTHVSPEIVDYSLYATACLVQGKKKELDELLTTADRLETKNTNEFLALCETYPSFMQRLLLTPQGVIRLLNNEKLAVELLSQEQVQLAIINFALANPQWWNDQAMSDLSKLRSVFEHPQDIRGNKAREALTTFGVQIAKNLYAAMMRNKTQISKVLMRMLYTVTPPDKDALPWLQLLNHLSEYMTHDKQFHPAKAFAWEFRAWLLQQWAYGYQQIPEELILPWLQLSWNDFTNLLALPGIPDKWRQLALMQLLSRSTEPLPKQIVNLFNNLKYRDNCIDALKELMSFASTQPAALRCFTKLVEYGYGDKISLLMTLLNAKSASKKDILTPELLDDFLRAVRMKDREKIEVLEQYGSLLLGASHQELAPTLVDIISVYVDKLTIEKLLDKSAKVTLQTLDLLGKQVDKLPSNLAKNIKAWVCISYGIVRKPFVPLPLEKKFLTSMGEYIVHFKLQNNTIYRESLFTVLGNSIHTVDQLRLVLETWATPLEKKTPKELLYDLSAFTGEQYNPTLSHQLLLPYIAISLEYASTLQSNWDKATFLAPLFKALLKNVNDDVFTELQKIALMLPKAYQKDWQQYAAPQGKRSLQQRLGDVMGSNLAASVIEGAKIIGGNVHPPHSPSTQTPVPPQQHQQPVKAQKQPDPFVPSPAHASAPHHKPQSIVNGQPIYPEQIVAVYKLNGPYIAHREDELKKEFTEHQKKKLGTEWILDERDILRNLSDIATTLKLLEMDAIIQSALGHFSVFNESQLDPKPLLEKVYRDVQKKYQGHPGEEVKNVLLVFVRYRILSEYFRRQNPPVRLNRWLEKQWITAQDQGKIIRSANPLPSGK